ncbi:MAG: phage major tail tube protein [Azoarcus sp.]|jgi:P2 family phage contractile tail tube protein|nr:phage major tail tube protein [Azoarcus sp.]
MALPNTLKNFNVFYNGTSYLGQCSEVELPKLTAKMEEYRGGGMPGPASIDLGIEKLEITHTYGGLMREAFREFGIPTADGVQMRFAGAYQRDDTGDTDAVEIVVRGRHSEIDAGTAKAGDLSEFKVTSQLTYYKLIVNGTTEVEIDTVNFIFIVGGVDRLADQRKALGL